MQVHPGIAHAVSRLCAFMAKPTHEVYAMAKRVLTWLRDRIHIGVTYGDPRITCIEDLLPRGAAKKPLDPERDFSLACTVDSDLNGRSIKAMTADQAQQSPPDRASSRSQLGYELSLAGGSFEAVSRRQHSVALDTAAAELFAASTAAAHLINITGVLRFLSFGVLGNDPVPMWCDNEACCLVTRDASSLKRLAYIARRVRFIQELEARRVISIQNIEGIKNPADVLTKYLGKPDYNRYTSRLYNGAVDPESHTCNAASAQRRKGGV